MTTGAVALHLRITTSLVHSWDLAHATGQATAVLLGWPLPTAGEPPS